MAEASSQSIQYICDEIIRIIRFNPEKCIWSPGKPWWIMAFLPQSGKTRSCIISLDGALTICMVMNPQLFERGKTYPMDSLVRCLAAKIKILKLASGISTFPIALDHSKCGTCCFLIDVSDIDWVVQEDIILPGKSSLEWNCPENIPSLQYPEQIPNFLTFHGFNSYEGCTLKEVLDQYGEPVEIAILQTSLRIEVLLSYWKRCIRNDINRLKFQKIIVPAFFTSATIDNDLQKIIENKIGIKIQVEQQVKNNEKQNTESPQPAVEIADRVPPGTVSGNPDNIFGGGSSGGDFNF